MKYLHALFSSLLLSVLSVLLVADITFAQDPQWVKTGSLTDSTSEFGRYAHTTTLLDDGRVLVTGGGYKYGDFVADSALSSAEIYDPNTGMWSKAGYMSGARMNHTATKLANGKVLIVGGIRNNVALSTCELFDPATGLWSPAGALNHARYQHTASLMKNGTVVVLGGVASSPHTVETYTPNTNTWGGVSGGPDYFYAHAAVVVGDDKILTVGGNYGVTGVTDKVVLFTIGGFLGGSFTLKTSYPRPIRNAVAGKLPNNKVAVFGGYSTGGIATDSAFIYDLGANTWTAIPSALPATAGELSMATLADGRFLILGGFSATGMTSARKNVSLYSPITNQILATTSLSNGRGRTSAVTLKNGHVLVAGGSKNNSSDYTTELYLSTSPVTDSAAKFRFFIDNFYAGLNCGPEMVPNTWAFVNMETNAGTRTSVIEQNIPLITNSTGVTVEFKNFSLSYFNKTNTAGRNNPNEVGFMGDERIYSGGTAKINYHGMTKVAFKDAIFFTKQWYTPPAGEKDSAWGYGIATVDSANSNPMWIEHFAGASGQVLFQFNSISDIIQNHGPFCTASGTYDADISVKPATVAHAIEFVDQLSGVNLNVQLDWNARLQLLLNVQNAILNSGAGTRRISAQRIFTSAGGTLPNGIEVFYPGAYWRIGSTFDTLAYSATFNLTGIEGISVPNNLRIIYRESSKHPWKIAPSYSLLTSPTRLVVNNLIGGAEYALASTTGNPLPVELVGMQSNVVGSTVQLTWQTATEKNNRGFSIERSIRNSSNFSEVGFVNGMGTTTEFTTYQFEDKNVAPGSYIYRIKQIDVDGTSEIVAAVESEVATPIAFELKQNYPNPFNPSTTIAYSLPESGLVEINVYSVLGSLVYSNSEYKNAGSHSFEFNAAGMPSGMYILSLKAGLYHSGIKMTLLK